MGIFGTANTTKILQVLRLSTSTYVPYTKYDTGKQKADRSKSLERDLVQHYTRHSFCLY
jgi:hypothetical protein